MLTTVNCFAVGCGKTASSAVEKDLKVAAAANERLSVKEDETSTLKTGGEDESSTPKMSGEVASSTPKTSVVSESKPVAAVENKSDVKPASFNDVSFEDLFKDDTETTPKTSGKDASSPPETSGKDAPSTLKNLAEKKESSTPKTSGEDSSSTPKTSGKDQKSAVQAVVKGNIRKA